MLFYSTIIAILVAVHFPYATDPRSGPAATSESARAFYEQAYAPSGIHSREEAGKEEIYAQVARLAAEAADIQGMVSRFVAQYRLQDRRILEVGAGRGYLQDIVKDYTGLDVSRKVRRYFHKPFVQASATAMPFKDGAFDAIWSIWVLEHVVNPEHALLEMRRVVKPGGLILLAPAWHCASWAAQGYQVRPYRDFGIGGKLVKASIPLRSSGMFQTLYLLPIRVLRIAAGKIGATPTRFRYRRLTANYDKYWAPDSDAANSMDPYEAVLWFESRGDKCVNCPEGLRKLTGAPAALVIRVKPIGR